MKKYFLLALLALLVLIAVAYKFLMPDDKLQVFRVGVECDHAPYNWEEDAPTESNFPLSNNEGFYAEGYDVQMAAMIADRIGAKIMFKKIAFENLIKALTRREIDAIFSGMVDTDERKKVITFSTPYEVSKVEYAVLINRKSKYANAESIKELEGAKMLAQTGSRFDDVIKQIPNVNHLPPMMTQQEIVEEVRNFKVDGTVLNYDTALSYAKTYNRELKVLRFSEGNGFDLGFTGLCAGVRKTDTKLLQSINDAINEIPTRERRRIMDHVITREWERTSRKSNEK